MATRNPDNRDLSRACWRCTHFGGIVAEVHASCTHGPGRLQASPVSGCVYWSSGSDDARPVDWMPDGFRLTERRVMWGVTGPSPAPPPAPDWETGRPGQPNEAAAWDRQQEQRSWRATDVILGRYRASTRSAAVVRPGQSVHVAGLPAHHVGPDDESAEALV